MLSGVAAASLLGGTEGASPEVRSGSPGYRKADNGELQHWHSPALTIYLDDSLKRLGPDADDAAMQAFGRWAESDPRLPNLAFDTGKTRSTPARDGLSTISYDRIETPGHERDLAITVTYTNRKSGEIIEADIVLNSLYPIGVLLPRQQAGTSTEAPSDADSSADRHDKDWRDRKGEDDDEATDCRERYDVQNVLTHEAGHFFGLGEDPVEHRAAMFQTIDRCETHKRVLATTDVNAVSTLYASSPAATAAVATGPSACSLTAPGGNGGGVWLGAILVGLLAYRRPRAARRC